MKNVISEYFSFFDIDGNLINDVLNVDIDEEGRFSYITYFKNGKEFKLNSSEYYYTNLILNVPGIGYAYSGDIVLLERYREKARRYKLHFGWHENTSNQKLYTWYLTPLILNEGESNVCKTLYYEDLTNILAIEHIVPGLIPG